VASEQEILMQTNRSDRWIWKIATRIAAVFLFTALCASPALAKHDDDDEQHGEDWHHEHREHHKHWHEYERHVYFPPPVVYGPPPGVYASPPPIVYAPPTPTLNVVIPISIH
jgi:hypothetical protein